MEIEPDFHFLSPEDVEIIGITPLARMFMENLLLYDDKYDKISDSNVYLMENSVLYKYDTKFNITGQIDDPQPKLDNNSIVLMINLLSDEENTTETDVNCNFNNGTGNNYYNLNCTAQEEFEGNLQFSMSFFDNGDILLVFFQDSNMSNIDINIDTKEKSSRRFYTKNSRGINGGIIAVIVIVSLVAVAGVIAAIYCLRKNSRNMNGLKYDSNSTIEDLKVLERNI